MARIPANEREPIGAIHNLTGPTKLWVTQFPKVCSAPAQKACKTAFDLFGFTWFVILSTDQKQVPTIDGLRQPNIVERVGRVPVKRVIDGCGWSRNADHVGTIGCLLGMHRNPVIERRVASDNGEKGRH